MAISVDTVYQRVLALANKEQRGYVTPQEFNLLANQVQQEIFERYFYDLNQRERIQPQVPGVQGEEDNSSLIDKKLAVHTTIETVIGGTKYPTNYTIGKVFVNDFAAEKLPRNEVVNINASARHVALADRSPVYCDSVVAGQDILVITNTGQATSGVTCEVLTKPADVEWDYVVVGQKALYNAGGSTNFDLHDSEETNLVTKICELAGIVINKAGLAQTFAQKDINEQQSKKV